MTGLLEGRPEDCSERLPKEIKTYDCLDALGISYGRVDHEPLMTMEACAEAEYIGMHPCINTSSLRLKTEDLLNRFLPAVGHDYIAVTLTGED